MRSAHQCFNSAVSCHQRTCVTSQPSSETLPELCMALNRSPAAQFSSTSHHQPWSSKASKHFRMKGQVEI